MSVEEFLGKGGLEAFAAPLEALGYDDVAALSDRDWSRASSARAGARASTTEQDYRYTDAYQSVAEEKRGPGARRPCAPPPALPTIEASGAAV